MVSVTKVARPLRVLPLLVAMLAGLHVANAQATRFTFTETASEELRIRMQTNAEALFSAIAEAADSHASGLNLSTKNLTTDAINRIQTLWAVSPFYCTETRFTTRVLRCPDGTFSVRGVPAYFELGATDEDRYQEMAIEFTPAGTISDLYIAVSKHQYTKIFEASTEVTDIMHREMILKVVEDFRTAYNRKDTTFLNLIYSDECLIITGKVVRTAPKNRDLAPRGSEKKVEYSVQSKKQYLNNLKKVFKSNSYINVQFSDIIITQHEGNPNIYGVTLKQGWNTSRYSDEGWLFLVFDYEDEEHPQIWVRTWQPLVDGDGKELPASEIFNLGDFRFR